MHVDGLLMASNYIHKYAMYSQFEEHMHACRAYLNVKLGTGALTMQYERACMTVRARVPTIVYVYV